MLSGMPLRPRMSKCCCSTPSATFGKNLPDGKPERLTDGSDLIRALLLPDGKDIVYVTWNDENMGAIWRMNPGYRKSKISAEKESTVPRLLPDGQQIVYRKATGIRVRLLQEPGIYLMPANGGTAKLVTPPGE